MPHIYQEVAALLNKGKPYEALEACMAEISHIHMKDLNRVAQLKGQSFAAERAKTLMWVAAAFAKQEEWEMGRDVARISYTIYPPAANTIENLYLNLLRTCPRITSAL